MGIPTDLDIAKDKIQELELLIIAMRSDIRELYAMRGEDELTAKYCSAMLDASREIE